jgi:hypothetical protein
LVCLDDGLFTSFLFFFGWPGSAGRAGIAACGSGSGAVVSSETLSVHSNSVLIIERGIGATFLVATHIPP